MKSSRPFVSIALVWTVAWVPVQAAAPAQPVAPAASAASVPAPAPAKPARRALTADELRNSAQFPDGSQPDLPLKPQVVVPLGRKPPPPLEPAASAPPGMAPAGSKVNDAVARCKAQSAPNKQAACVHASAASANESR